MRIWSTVYTQEDSARRVKVTNRADETQSTIFVNVLYLTEEIDNEGSRFAVLHHADGETSTFGLIEWRVQAEQFFDIF